MIESEFNAADYVFLAPDPLLLPRRVVYTPYEGNRQYRRKVSETVSQQEHAKWEEYFLSSYLNGTEAYRRQLEAYMQKLVDNPQYRESYNCRGYLRKHLFVDINHQRLPTIQYGFARENYSVTLDPVTGNASLRPLPGYDSKPGIIGTTAYVVDSLLRKPEGIVGWKANEQGELLYVSEKLWEMGPNIIPTGLQHPEEYKSVPIIGPHPRLKDMFAIEGFRIIHTLTGEQMQQVLRLTAAAGGRNYRRL